MRAGPGVDPTTGSPHPFLELFPAARAAWNSYLDRSSAFFFEEGITIIASEAPDLARNYYRQSADLGIVTSQLSDEIYRQFDDQLAPKGFPYGWTTADLILNPERFLQWLLDAHSDLIVSVSTPADLFFRDGRVVTERLEIVPAFTIVAAGKATESLCHKLNIGERAVQTRRNNSGRLLLVSGNNLPRCNAVFYGHGLYIVSRSGSTGGQVMWMIETLYSWAKDISDQEFVVDAGRRVHRAFPLLGGDLTCCVGGGELIRGPLQVATETIRGGRIARNEKALAIWTDRLTFAPLLAREISQFLPPARTDVDDVVTLPDKILAFRGPPPRVHNWTEQILPQLVPFILEY